MLLQQLSVLLDDGFQFLVLAGVCLFGGCDLLCVLWLSGNLGSLVGANDVLQLLGQVLCQVNVPTLGWRCLGTRGCRAVLLTSLHYSELVLRSKQLGFCYGPEG